MPSGDPGRRYDEPMTSQLRVLVEQPTRGKRWVAVAADWPGLERGGKTEDEAVEKLARYVPRYLPVAKRVRLGSELATQTDLDIIGRYPGVGSTDFWGISFAPSPLDREPFDAPTFDRQVRLLRAAWAEFDETAARVSAELRPGARGGGRSRDRIVRHVLANEGGDFSKRVKAKSELEDLLTPGGLAHHRDRFVEAMRAWYAEGKPLGNWTIPYLLRHTAYHVLDHTWEMQDRDLTDDASAGMTSLRRLQRERLGQRDEDALGATDVAEPIAVLVPHHLADEFGTVGPQAGNDVLDVVDFEHDATDAQRVHRGVFGSALVAVGVWNLVSSTRPWPSGVRIIAMSLRTPSSPMRRSTDRPSTVASPSSSIPSSTKNAIAASRSSTTTPTLSIRRIVMSPSLVSRRDQPVSAASRRLRSSVTQGPAAVALVRWSWQ